MSVSAQSLSDLSIMGEAMKRVALIQAENILNMRLESISTVAIIIMGMIVLWIVFDSLAPSRKPMVWRIKK